MRNINLLLTNRELEKIRIIREKIQPENVSARRSATAAPKKRLAISQHDWCVLAIQEKIEREYQEPEPKLNSRRLAKALNEFGLDEMVENANQLEKLKTVKKAIKKHLAT